MPSRKSIHVALILCCIISSGCGRTSEPARPEEEPVTDFTAVKAEIAATEGYLTTDCYSIDFTSDDGKILSMTLTSHSLLLPAGTYRSNKTRAHGTITDLHFSNPSDLRERASGAVLTLTPDGTGYALSGTLSTNKTKDITVKGNVAIDFKPTARTLTFASLASCDESSDGVVLHFIGDVQNGESYEFSVKLSEYQKLADIGGGEYSFEYNPGLLCAKFTELTESGNIAPGEASQTITSGTLYTSLNGNVLSGIAELPAHSIRFTCEIPGKAETEYTELPQLLSVKQTSDDFISIKTAQKTVVMNYNPVTWQTEYTGEGLMLDLEIHAPDGTLSAGKYTVSDKAMPGTFRAGWNPGDIYGIGIDFENWGSCLYRFGSEGKKVTHIGDGLVTVSKDGETYTITLVSSSVAARYTGPIPKATETGR